MSEGVLAPVSGFYSANRGQVTLRAEGEEIVAVVCPERYAETVSLLVRWLDGGVDPSSIRFDRRGQSVQAALEVKGSPERVLQVASQKIS